MRHTRSDLSAVCVDSSKTVWQRDPHSTRSETARLVCVCCLKLPRVHAYTAYAIPKPHPAVSGHTTQSSEITPKDPFTKSRMHTRTKKSRTSSASSLILVESCPPSPTRGPHTNDSARADEATDLIPCAQIHPSMSVRHHNTPPDRESREHSAPATKAVGVYDPAIPVPRGPLCSCTLGAHAGIDQNPHLVLGAF